MVYRPSSTRAWWTGCLLVLLGACSVPPQGWPPGGEDTGSTSDVAVSLTGTVTASDGTAVAGAFLVTDPHGYETVSGADGSFGFHPLPPGTLRVVARHPEAGAGSLDGVELPEDGSPVAISLVLASEASAGLLEVTVEGPDGLGAAGIRVEAGGVSAETDASGVALLEGLAGETVDVVIRDPAERAWSRTLADVSVPDPGTARRAVRLSGRPPAGSGFMGSASCGMCHAGAADAHETTRHAGTLQDDVPSPLREQFEDGASAVDGSVIVRLGLLDDRPAVTLEAATGEARTFAVDGLIGDPRGGSVPFTRIGGRAFPLPVGWVAAREFPRTWAEAEARLEVLPAETWLAGDGFAFAEGEAPDPSRSAENLCLPCHATGFELALEDDGGVTMTASRGEGSWTTAGVGCERCHGPGSGHVSASSADKSWTITRPERLDADRAAEVCGQCHAATRGLGSGLPYPFHADDGFFQPGEVLADFAEAVPEDWPSGAAAGPGQQADEHARSVHGSAADAPLRCFDCHHPHGAATTGDGAATTASCRVEPADNGLCLACHAYLDFGTDDDAAAHTAHHIYDPTGPTLGGRCTACHMPPTAARLRWQESSGAGDLASHLYEALPPLDTLDVFDAAGASTLPVGSFPAHACSECHAYSAAWIGAGFVGPSGDPTLRETHAWFQTAFEELYP